MRAGEPLPVGRGFTPGAFVLGLYALVVLAATVLDG